jgi:hypothetical protein
VFVVVDVDEDEELDSEDSVVALLSYALSFTAVAFFCTHAVISVFRVLLPPIPPPPSWM